MVNFMVHPVHEALGVEQAGSLPRCDIFLCRSHNVRHLECGQEEKKEVLNACVVSVLLIFIAR